MKRIKNDRSLDQSVDQMDLLCKFEIFSCSVFYFRAKPESNQHSVSGIWPLGYWWNKKTVSYTNKTDFLLLWQSVARFLSFTAVCFYQWYSCWLHSWCADWRHSRTDCGSAAGHCSQVTRGSRGGQKVSFNKYHSSMSSLIVFLN